MDGLEGTTTEDIQLPASSATNSEQNYAQTPPRKRRGTTNEYPFNSPTAMSSIERSPCPSTFADSATMPNTPDYNAALMNTNTTTVNINDKVNDVTSTNIIDSTPINNRHHTTNNKNNQDTPNTESNTPSSTNTSLNESSSSANVSLNSSGLMNDLPIKCNCKKSKCLKLYCECFSALEYCDGCNCINCLNTHEHEKDREAAIKVTKERNNTAFSPKVCEKSTTSADSENHTFIHAKGCRCKKSNCLKKYCECYQHGVACTDGCKCCECKNRPIDSNNNNNNNNAKSNKKHVTKTPNSSRIKLSSPLSSSLSSLNSNSILKNLDDFLLFGKDYPLLDIKILEHIWSYLPSDDIILSSKVNKNWLKMAFIMKEKEKQNNYM